jgi:hypothetical protein
MGPMAVVTVAIFGFLILAPVLAAFALRVKQEESSRSRRVVEFPTQRKAETLKHRRETDAA